MKDNQCPLCCAEIVNPMHTDKEIRALGSKLEWDIFSVCEDCYIVLREYREIVKETLTASS